MSPHDGSPNLRPGVSRVPFSPAPLFAPELFLDELFAEFLAASRTIINARTRDDYDYAWTQFRDWLRTTEAPPILGSFTKELCTRYVAYLQTRPKKRGAGTLSSYSTHGYTRPLRTFARWMVAEGYYPTDPFAGGGRGIMPRLGPRVLKVGKQADVEILLAGTEAGGRNRIERAVRGRDEFIVWLAADTGLRTSDVVNLRIGQVDADDGWAFIAKGKWDRQRRVPLSPETVRAMELYLRRHRPVLTGIPAGAVRPDDHLVVSNSGEPLTSNGLYQAVARAYRRGKGDGPFGLHRLRHLFGTAAAEKGMHPTVSQQIMGHEDPKSQKIYQHPSDEVIKSEHAKVTPIRDLRAPRRRRLA